MPNSKPLATFKSTRQVALVAFHSYGNSQQTAAVALQAALDLASDGKKVLVIDADHYSPTFRPSSSGKEPESAVPAPASPNQKPGLLDALITPFLFQEKEHPQLDNATDRFPLADYVEQVQLCQSDNNKPPVTVGVIHPGGVTGMPASFLKQMWDLHSGANPPKQQILQALTSFAAAIEESPYEYALVILQPGFSALTMATGKFATHLVEICDVNPRASWGSSQLLLRLKSASLSPKNLTVVLISTDDSNRKNSNGHTTAIRSHVRRIWDNPKTLNVLTFGALPTFPPIIGDSTSATDAQPSQLHTPPNKLMRRIEEAAGDISQAFRIAAAKALWSEAAHLLDKWPEDRELFPLLLEEKTLGTEQF